MADAYCSRGGGNSGSGTPVLFYMKKVIGLMAVFTTIRYYHT